MTYDNNTSKLAIGLFSSEIHECVLTDPLALDKAKFTNVLSGHFSQSTTWTNEVWGLQLFNKDRDLYMTCSMDGTLRVWSISGKRQIRAIRLDISESGAVLPLDPKTKDLQDSGKLMCVAIDQDDKVACVGCKDGTIRFVDLIAFKQIKMVKIAAEWISDIKWAPNNTKLAIGSHDNAIYIMSYPDLKYNKRSKLKKHSSFITHLDWSRDSSFLHSTCGAYEILFWDTLSMKQMTSGTYYHVLFQYYC